MNYLQKTLSKIMDIRGKKIEEVKQGLNDSYLDDHQKRVSVTCVSMGKFGHLNDRELNDLSVIAELHDIGKYNIELNSAVSAELAKFHAHIGSEILKPLQPYVPRICDVVRMHHERYDGKGPDGVKGLKIPLYARILAVSDKLDHLLYNRRGSTKIKLNDAIFEIVSEAEKAFDPFVVDMLRNVKRDESSKLNESVQTDAFGASSYISLIELSAKKLRKKGWELEDAIKYLSKGRDEKPYRVVVGDVWHKPQNPYLTFNDANMMYSFKVDKNKKMKKLSSNDWDVGNCLIVCVKKVLDDFSVSDIVKCKGEKWSIRWIDNNRFMLVR